jgi:hypothetical protein
VSDCSLRSTPNYVKQQFLSIIAIPSSSTLWLTFEVIKDAKVGTNLFCFKPTMNLDKRSSIILQTMFLLVILFILLMFYASAGLL